MFLLGLYVAVLTFSVTQAETCEPLKIPMCKNIGYKMTKVPNNLGHSKQDDANIELHQYFPLMKVQCSSHLAELLCSFYAPKCDSDITKSVTSLPSRQICQQVRTDCESSMIKYGLDWPEEIKCDDLKDEDDTHQEQVAWSDNIEDSDDSIQLSIKYSTDAITFASCCQVFYYSQKVFYIQNGADVKVQSADVRSSNVPKVTVKGAKSGLKRSFTTLLMVTGYTDKKENGGEKPYIYTNWMVTNIRNTDVSTGTTVQEYDGPHPTSNTDSRVFFLLYKHPKAVSLSSFGKYNSPENTRMKMDLDTFVNDNKMVLVASKYMVVDVDEYSRYKSLTENGEPESVICNNVQNYPALCNETKENILQRILKK